MNLTEGRVLSLAREVLGKEIKVVEVNRISTERRQGNPVDIVMKLRSMGYAFSTVGGFINFTYCRKGNPPKGSIPLLRELKAHKQNGWIPQDPCLLCRACGHWPGHEGNPFCFHDAVFRGKPGNPKPIEKARDPGDSLMRKHEIIDEERECPSCGRRVSMARVICPTC